MEEIGLFSKYPIIQLISYIITVIIGGVGFKFYKERNDQQSNKKQMDSNDNQHLIQNLNDRVNNLTNVVQKFEKEREEIHKRELERTRELAEARADVRILTEKVKHLQETIERLVKENKKYKEKFGEVE